MGVRILSRRRGKGCALCLVMVVLAAVVLTACKHPDTFNGCSQHPGQCDRTATP